ncbi:hypothetical protein L2E82_42898 [Cichorium intybus]|uniref:Uncharacterized protein n=1 Tax=Cichorium intybus TaxID=13427 RepID=A0ACB8ZP14_CICIN|nr:hypothetical protein L2E82_42898 [Cichorium intybus]
MKDLSVLVIDQGTIIDRIDYNIQNVVVSVDEGLKQLQKAERNQKQGGMVMCATVLKVLSASPSAYSANPKSKLSSPPSFSRSSISLVSVQARNNARIVFSGSLDLFSNKHAIFYNSSSHRCKRYAKSGNQQFATEISKWVFHERGHLKAVNVRHHRVGETDEPAIYRINDELGLYLASFKVPDVYGVFQFKVEYQRLGYTSLSLAKQTEQMRRIVNELYSIHFSIKKASQLVKEIGRQVNL